MNCLTLVIDSGEILTLYPPFRFQGGAMAVIKLSRCVGKYDVIVNRFHDELSVRVVDTNEKALNHL